MLKATFGISKIKNFILSLFLFQKYWFISTSSPCDREFSLKLSNTRTIPNHM